MEIQKTKEYEKFDTILGNRIINEKKVERLMDDINKGLNLLPYCPIIVYPENGKLRIVDGQHRFETSKRLESEIHYVECDPLDLKQIARLNSRSDKWSNKDFLLCYVRLGMEDYSELKYFIKKFDVTYSAAVDLLMHGSPMSKNSMDKFRDGEFVSTYLGKSKLIMDEIHSIFEEYPFKSDTNLIIAFQKLQEKKLCDFQILRNKLKDAPSILEKQSSWKKYVYNIEEVYNFKCSKRTVIF